MNRIYRLTDVDLALLWVIGAFFGCYLGLVLVYLGVM